MANTIKLKRASGSDPSASDLSVGELAIRTSNCKLFSRNDGGSAVGIVAGSADTLTTARTIAGVSFDGSANISLNNNAITNGAGYLADIVSDSSPQLGGDLDVQSNKITTATSNGNVKIEPNGTGVVEVRGAGGNDGKLQLNCSAQSHGIKLASPAHSAGQSYTLIFPDNQIAADKYLKIKSISGSGSTAIGQAEYASLDANDLGEGTVPDARFPSTLPALNGSALTDLNGSNIASGTIAAARVATLNQDTTGSSASCTGNAATATALANARTIAGVSFDGTSNISLNNNAITNGAGYITNSVTSDLTITSTDAGSSAAPELELYRNSASPADADYLGQLKFTGESDDGSKEVYAKITGKISDASSGTEDGIIEFAHRKAGSNVITARFTSTAFKLINGTELEAEGGATVTGNIAVTGTVDGRDIATDGTKLDGIESGATADQSASEIVALIADQTIAPSTIDMEDNEKIKLGTGDDLEIFHNGSDSIIEDSGTGNLNILSSKAQILNPNANEAMAKFIENGAVELYFNNSKKFETVTGGATITGTCTATAFSGDGSALTGISAGATGGGSDEIFYENGQNVTTNYTITNGKNAMSAGPITIDSGVTVTVGAGETLTIV